VIGGLLVESSWRWIFLINLPIIVAALAAGAAILPRRDAAPSGPRAGRRTTWRERCWSWARWGWYARP
jgi:MFS family permease